MISKITIGVPVYNGEKFLAQRFNSIFSQTFTDFEVIISDNASTDSTQKICEELARNDKRIHYIRQKKNMGFNNNINFLLNEAKTEYFVWAAVDDYWHPDFLKKNIETLVSHPNVVGSISKIKYFEVENPTTKSEKIDLQFRQFIKKIRVKFKPRGIFPLYGSYEQKVKYCLKKVRLQILFGVYKTEVLKKSVITEQFMGNDLCLVLNILKHGNIHVIEDILFNVFDAGQSKRGYIAIYRQENINKLGAIFPYFPLTYWCAKDLGVKQFFKNIDYFIQLNLWGEFTVVIDLIRLLTKKIYH